VADHIAKLFQERFTALEGRFRNEIAFDAATLLASRVEHHAAAQADLTSTSAVSSAALGIFVDRLHARFGDDAVRRFAFRESHLPEQAASATPLARKSAAPSPTPAAARPFLLLPQAEEIVATAEVPDYPPRRFTWRRVSHRVVKADGPERIAPEWWQGGQGAAPARDYYAVEDEASQRFWLYREGAYAPGGPAPRWFLHGLLP
jgi:protein ImuB